jgi:hypothetical protein
VFPGYLTGRKQMPTPQLEPLRRLSRAERAALQRIAAQRKRKAGVVTVVDPQTEVKRGSSNSPTTSLKA